MLQDLKHNLQVAETKLQDLKSELVAAIPKASSPDDPNLNRIENEIDETAARVRRIKAMIEAGKIAESQASIEARNANCIANAEKAKNITKNRTQLAAKIDKAIAALGVLLDQWKATGLEAHAAVCEVHTLDDLPWLETLLNSARGDNGMLAGALDHALFKAGVGEIGIYSDTFSPRKPLGEFYTLEWAAEHAAKQVTVRIDDSLRNVLAKEC